jgi:hypothetical protein
VLCPRLMSFAAPKLRSKQVVALLEGRCPFRGTNLAKGTRYSDILARNLRNMTSMSSQMAKPPPAEEGAAFVSSTEARGRDSPGWLSFSYLGDHCGSSDACSVVSSFTHSVVGRAWAAKLASEAPDPITPFPLKVMLAQLFCEPNVVYNPS